MLTIREIERCARMRLDEESREEIGDGFYIPPARGETGRRVRVDIAKVRYDFERLDRRKR